MNKVKDSYLITGKDKIVISKAEFFYLKGYEQGIKDATKLFIKEDWLKWSLRS